MHLFLLADCSGIVSKPQGIEAVEGLYESLQRCNGSTKGASHQLLARSWVCSDGSEADQAILTVRGAACSVLFIEKEPSLFAVGTALKTASVQGVDVFYGLLGGATLQMSGLVSPPHLVILHKASRVAELRIDPQCYDQIASALSNMVTLQKNIFEMSSMELTVRSLQRVRFLSTCDFLPNLFTDDEIELLVQQMRESSSDDVSALVESYMRNRTSQDAFISRCFSVLSKVKAKKARRRARALIIHRVRLAAGIDDSRNGLYRSNGADCTETEDCETTETEQEESFERLSTLEIAPFTDKDEAEDGNYFSQLLAQNNPSKDANGSKPAIMSVEKTKVLSGSINSEERHHNTSENQTSLKSLEKGVRFFHNKDAGQFKENTLLQSIQSPWARGFVQSFINKTLAQPHLHDKIEDLLAETDLHLRKIKCRAFEESSELVLSQMLSAHGLSLKSLDWMDFGSQSVIQQNFEATGDIEALVADFHKKLKGQSNQIPDRRMFNRQLTCPHEFYKPDHKSRSMYGLDLEHQIRSREQLERLNMKVFYHKKDALLLDSPPNRGSGGRILDTSHFDMSSGMASGTKYQHVYSPQNYKTNKFNVRAEVSSGNKPLKSMLDPVTPNSGGNPRHIKRNSVDLYNSKRGFNLLAVKPITGNMGLHADVESDEESSSILSSMSPLHRSKSRMTLEFPHQSVFDKQLAQFYKVAADKIIKLTKQSVTELSAKWEFSSQELANLHKTRQQPLEFFQWISRFRRGTPLTDLVKMDGFCDCLVAEHSVTLDENRSPMYSTENFVQADKSLFDKFITAELRNLLEKDTSPTAGHQLALERLVSGSNTAVLSVFEVWMSKFDDKELIESLNIAHKVVFSSHGNNLKLNLHKAKENSDDSSDEGHRAADLNTSPKAENTITSPGASPGANKPSVLARLKSGAINKLPALDLKDTDSYPMATHGTSGAKQNHLAGVSELMNSPNSRLEMMHHSSLNTEKGSMNARISAIEDLNGSPLNPMRSPGLAPSLISPNERGGWDSPGKDSIVLESQKPPAGGQRLVLQLQSTQIPSPSNKMGTMNSLAQETMKSLGIGTSRTVQSHQDYSDMFQLLPCVTKTKDMKFEFFMNNIFAKMKNEYGLTQHQYFQFIKEVKCGLLRLS